MEEEQQMELEALEAIYMDDFELLSSDPPCSFSIILNPEGVIDEDTTDSELLVHLGWGKRLTRWAV